MLIALNGCRGKISLLTFVLMQVSSVGFSVAGETQLAALDEMARKCFRLRQVNICRLALKRAETLQRVAAMKKNYSCQTLALGLGADLIMSQHREGRGDAAFQLLEDVNRTCLEH